MSDFGQPLSFEEIKQKSDQYILNTYKRAPIAFHFGQGEYLYDSENRPYLDFVSGVAVNALGHGDADLVEAIRDQADRIVHSSNLYYNQEQALLAEALIGHSFPGKVFFCNSGTEANEAAIKLARAFGHEKGGYGILSLEDSFHGRTTGAMTLTGQEKIHGGFGPLFPQVKYIPANDITALEAEIQRHGSELCALFLEPVQGEMGVIPMEKDYVRAARQLTREHNMLLIFDEIQTGIGRTGKLFAYEHFGIEPDVLTLAKALGSGYPIGAMIVQEQYARYLGPGRHGSTFGGNHLGARIAYETLKIIMSREILQHINGLSEYMFHRLNLMKSKYPFIKEVRGLGLHIGILLGRQCADIVDQCRNEGLLINCAGHGDAIRLVPPLTLSIESADKGLTILEKVFASVT